MDSSLKIILAGEREKISLKMKIAALINKNYFDFVDVGINPLTEDIEIYFHENEYFKIESLCNANFAEKVARFLGTQSFQFYFCRNRTPELAEIRNIAYTYKKIGSHILLNDPDPIFKMQDYEVMVPQVLMGY